MNHKQRFQLHFKMILWVIFNSFFLFTNLNIWLLLLTCNIFLLSSIFQHLFCLTILVLKGKVQSNTVLKFKIEIKVCFTKYFVQIKLLIEYFSLCVKYVNLIVSIFSGMIKQKILLQSLRSFNSIITVYHWRYIKYLFGLFFKSFVMPFI